MAVYTHLGAEDLAELIGHYDVGRRIDVAELPFFLDLLDHLADQNCPVPRTIHDREGSSHRKIDGKSIALIAYLPGVSVDHPTPEQAYCVGKALAKVHLAASSYGRSREQGLGLAEWKRTIAQCGDQALATIDPALPSICAEEFVYLSAHWPSDLPQGVSHCDLFPDNVLMLDNQVGGLIDFYFAANDFFAYDLAVTHAAWSFERSGAHYREAIGKALLRGYNQIRELTDAERQALPILARGATMRFISSRADDWLNAPDDALVTRKDPMDFAKRLEFYRHCDAKTFA